MPMSTRSSVPANSTISTAIRCNARDRARASRRIVRLSVWGRGILKGRSYYGGEGRQRGGVVRRRRGEAAARGSGGGMRRRRGEAAGGERGGGGGRGGE